MKVPVHGPVSFDAEMLRWIRQNVLTQEGASQMNPRMMLGFLLSTALFVALLVLLPSELRPLSVMGYCATALVVVGISLMRMPRELREREKGVALPSMALLMLGLLDGAISLAGDPWAGWAEPAYAIIMCAIAIWLIIAAARYSSRSAPRT